MPYARTIATVPLTSPMVPSIVDQSNGSFLDGTQTGTCADMHLISDLLLSFTQGNGAPRITLHVPMVL
ncbi:unnamed protein product [Musa hybrid cultivar]